MFRFLSLSQKSQVRRLIRFDCYVSITIPPPCPLANADKVSRFLRHHAADISHLMTTSTSNPKDKTKVSFNRVFRSVMTRRYYHTLPHSESPMCGFTIVFSLV